MTDQTFTEREKAQLRSAYARLVPENVVEELMARAKRDVWNPDCGAARAAVNVLLFNAVGPCTDDQCVQTRAAIEQWLELAHCDPDEVQALGHAYVKEAEILKAERQRRAHPAEEEELR